MSLNLIKGHLLTEIPHRFDSLSFGTLLSAERLRENCGDNIPEHEDTEGLVIALMDDGSGTPYLGKSTGASDYAHMKLDFEHITPSTARQAAADFQRTVLAHLQKRGGGAGRRVAVFCEDGCNLAGYCIVSFLRQVFKMPLSTALQAFAEARPPGIFHAPYLDDLHALHGAAAAALAPPPPPPPTPDWAAGASRLGF
jgi:hypothetical protein